MIDPVLMKLIWAGIVLAAYGLFRWRWLVATQEVVIGAVRDAERWGRSPRASAPVKDAVEHLANAAYRPVATWGIAVGVSLGVVLAVIRELRGKHAAPAQTDTASEEALVAVRLLAAVLITSPIALLLAIVVFCLGLLFLGSAKAVLGLIPEATAFGRMRQPST